jgi:hypothetical protein
MNLIVAYWRNYYRIWGEKKGPLNSWVRMTNKPARKVTGIISKERVGASARKPRKSGLLWWDPSLKIRPVVITLSLGAYWVKAASQLHFNLRRMNGIQQVFSAVNLISTLRQAILNCVLRIDNLFFQAILGKYVLFEHPCRTAH